MEWPTLTSWRHFFPRMWASQCKASQCKVRTHRRSEDATHFLTYPIDATLSEGERNREIFAVLGCYAE